MAAVTLGIHALAHTLIMRQEKISDEFIALMKQTNTYQMCTLQTMDSGLTHYYLDRLDEPLLDLVVPKVELKTARDTKMRQLALAMGIEYGSSQPPSSESGFAKLYKKYPFIYTALFSTMMRLFNSKKKQEKIIENSKDAILRLHQAGVPIVLGSDAAHMPSAIYDFHGFSTLREIELLGQAGLSNAETIKAATLNPAKMLGLSHKIGAIEKGKQGDLVLLKQNPLENLEAVRSIQWTVKDGIAHTPEEWMNL